jgi:HSP20 family protein
MALQRWSPFRELDALRAEFDDLFDRMFGRRAAEPKLMGPAERPALESFTERDKFVVRADLPGVSPNDVEITLVDNVLTVRGSRREEREEKKRNYMLRETSYGTFERAITVPRGIKADDIKAKFADGVLEMTMPLPKEAAARKVPIEAAGTERKAVEAKAEKAESKARKTK